MTDFVEIPDDNSSENEAHDGHNSSVTLKRKLNSHPAFEELKTLRSEMEFRGSLLGKTWSELSSIMSRYQAQLYLKHEELDSSLSAGEHVRLTQMEDELKRYKTESERLHRHVGELEAKLLDKDTEIVKLRTETHKFKNEVQMKENLIQKIQSQMAKEALEYQTEITSLRDMLEQGPCDVSADVPVAMPSPPPKRRKAVPKPLIPRPTISTPAKSFQPTLVPTSVASLSADGREQSTASPVKTESFQSSCAMSDPATSQSGEQMDSVYDNADESFDQSQDGAQEHQFFKVDEVYDESNSGVEGLMLQGEDAQMMLQNMPQGQGANQNMDSWDKSRPSMVSIASMLHTQLTTPISPRRQCEYCSQWFSNVSHLRRHITNIHLGLKPYECLVCLQKFARKDHASLHIKNKHKRSIVGPLIGIVTPVEKQ